VSPLLFIFSSLTPSTKSQIPVLSKQIHNPQSPKTPGSIYGWVVPGSSHAPHRTHARTYTVDVDQIGSEVPPIPSLPRYNCRPVLPHSSRPRQRPFSPSSASQEPESLSGQALDCGSKTSWNLLSSPAETYTQSLILDSQQSVIPSAYKTVGTRHARQVKRVKARPGSRRLSLDYLTISSSLHFDLVLDYFHRQMPSRRNVPQLIHLHAFGIIVADRICPSAALCAST
jgi:hypothetical protein